MEPVRDLELYRGLEQALGANVATALMDRLPPEPVQELVTKTDLRTELATLRQELKGDIAVLDQRMTGGFATFEQRMTGGFATFEQRMTGQFATFEQRMTGEFATFDQRMTGEFATFDQRMTGEFASLRHEMNAMKHELTATVRGEMIAAIHTQGRQLAFTLAGSLVGLSGLAFAIANLAA